MKANIIDVKGKIKSETVEIEAIPSDVRVNVELLSQYNYVYLSNQRVAGAKTKNRGEVSGGGKKPWKQKGTGRARSGSNRSPIWRKGGITFGPTGEQNYKKSMPVKMKKLAFVHAFISHGQAETLFVSEDLAPKNTAEIVKYLEGTKMTQKGILFVHSNNSELYRNGKNLKGLLIKDIKEVNAYDVLTSRNIIVMQSALEDLKTRI